MLTPTWRTIRSFAWVEAPASLKYESSDLRSRTAALRLVSSSAFMLPFPATTVPRWR